MSETLVISSRGQITLPAALRRRLGIKGGDVIILEERGTEVVFKPGVVLEYAQYSDDDINAWDRDDQLSKEERAKILERLQHLEQ